METTRKKSAAEYFVDLFPLISLAVVIIAFSILTGGRLLGLRNLRRIFNQSFALLFLSGSVIFLMAQDCMDMSVSAIVGMSAAVAAYLSDISVPVALLGALAVGLGIGAVNGFFNGVLKLNTMICTLAVQFILRGLLLIICKSGTVGISLAMFNMDSFALKVIVAVIFLVVGYFFFRFHTFGKQCRAIGAGSVAAIQSGVNITKVRVIGYLLTGFSAGLAGFFLVIRTGAAMYNTGNNMELDTLIALILGGMAINGGADSRYRSAIIGVLILGILNNGMVLMGLSTYPQLITKGIVFILVLALTFTMRTRIKTRQQSN